MTPEDDQSELFSTFLLQEHLPLILNFPLFSELQLSLNFLAFSLLLHLNNVHPLRTSCNKSVALSRELQIRARLAQQVGIVSRISHRPMFQRLYSHGRRACPFPSIGALV